MIPLSRTPIWSPVETLDDVDVILVERNGEQRVEVVDTRAWNVLVSLPPDEAAQSGVQVIARAMETVVEPIPEDVGCG